MRKFRRRTKMALRGGIAALVLVLALAAWAQNPPYLVRARLIGGILCAEYTFAFLYSQDQRVPPEDRKFTSEAVETVIANITSRMADPTLARIFENCFPNTLDTTVDYHGYVDGQPDTFIITGDIHAMWLRDSTNQVAPYIHLIPSDPSLDALVCGLVHRQSRNVLHDPFANAFNDGPEGGGWQDDDRIPEMTLELHEGKYELDSLAAFVRLSNEYYNASGSLACFDATWVSAIALSMETTRTMQAGTEEDYDDPPYRFNRYTNVATDTLIMQGRGPPAKRCGLSKCMFRPSDDATTFPYLVPANAMMAHELQRVAPILAALGEAELAEEAASLGAELREAVMTHGVVNHPVFGTIFAYEVDCYASSYDLRDRLTSRAILTYSCRYFMDDANIPGLLSLPYLGFIERDDPLYLRTRAFVLSENNPYFFSGTAGSGIGGPHVGYNYIWPMAVTMRALTSTDDNEIIECLNVLKSTTAERYFMHEGFHKDDPSRFTRVWFAWANSLFGELILQLAKERPHLIF